MPRDTAGDFLARLPLSAPPGRRLDHPQTELLSSLLSHYLPPISTGIHADHTGVHAGHKRRPQAGEGHAAPDLGAQSLAASFHARDLVPGEKMLACDALLVLEAAPC
jgi:hypothetical protein